MKKKSFFSEKNVGKIEQITKFDSIDPIDMDKIKGGEDVTSSAKDKNIFRAILTIFF